VKKGNRESGKLRVSVKNLTDFLRCPYIIRNRIIGAPFAVNEDILIGALVHAARVALNPVKRKCMLKGNGGEDLGYHIWLALRRASRIVPFSINQRKVFRSSFEILFKEWEWERELEESCPIDTIYPVRMEEPIKFPPGIYGQTDGLLLRDGCPTPIEYKTWDKGFEDIDRFQLLAYCAGARFKYRANVPFGVLQYSCPPKRMEVEFSAREGEFILEIYRELVEFFSNGETSHSPNLRACIGCGYLTCKHRR